MRCTNCGAHVSDTYARVFAPSGDVEVCPHCPDHCRDRHGRRKPIFHHTPTTRGVSD